MTKTIAIVHPAFKAACALVILALPVWPAEDASLNAPAAVPKASQCNLIRVPLVRQSTDYSCGAAALQSVLGYFGKDRREQSLMKQLGTNTYDGTNFKRIVKLAKSMGLCVKVHLPMSEDELRHCLDQGAPVICLVQAWSEDKHKDYENDWSDGHYVVAVGYDKDNIYLMDPSTLGNYAFVARKEFLKRWHDREQHTHLQHLGLSFAAPDKPLYDPDACLKME